MFNYFSKTMNNVKKAFSIKDLENLSGIKAHTIRIWEKRYALLSPERTATNIRTYSLGSLQKLLNITLLYNNGFKISKIAKIPNTEIPSLVQEIVSKNSIRNHSINAFKLAMMNFDQTLFMNTYTSLLREKTFQEIFHTNFIPLLNEVGLLWQTGTIGPAHEHFISSLIKQKILLNTEKLQYSVPTKTDKIFVLFLPDNEIHDIGLLYLNYEIILKGYKSIYLGQSTPLKTLEDVMKYFDDLYFLSYYTVAPPKDKIKKYIDDFDKLTKDHGNCKLWVIGNQTQYLEGEELPSFFKIFSSIQQIVSSL